MLELSDKDSKVAIIIILQQIKVDTLKINANTSLTVIWLDTQAYIAQ